MRTLTNDYNDCELVNLGYNRDGRGPYILRQDGVPPDSLNSPGRPLLAPEGPHMGYQSNRVYAAGERARAVSF